MKASSVIRKSAGALSLPLLTWLLMSVVCRIAGSTLFTGVSTFQLYVRGLAYVLLLAFGMSVNMHTGRFDFSAGAVMLLSGVVGAQLSYSAGVGPVAMFFISVLVGSLVGCLTGLLYVLLRLPPVIIGLGMTLVLEGVVAIITGGCKPVGFGTDSSYYRFAVTIPAMLLICAGSLTMMVILFHYTAFGYDYRALQTGQRIAVNTGVREKQNAVLCYLIAGILFGGAGAISVCSTNGITPTINFSSIASIFSCFLPLFFSGFIEKFCNKQLAVFLGCIAYEFIQIGFGQISFRIGAFTPDVYSVVEALILVLFLIYLNNERTVQNLFRFRRDRSAHPKTAEEQQSNREEAP